MRETNFSLKPCIFLRKRKRKRERERDSQIEIDKHVERNKLFGLDTFRLNHAYFFEKEREKERERERQLDIERETNNSGWTRFDLTRQIETNL